MKRLGSDEQNTVMKSRRPHERDWTRMIGG